jgi:hypothetical protein
VNEALIRRAALVLDPAHAFNRGTFDGTFNDAIDAVIAFAYGVQAADGPDAQHHLTEMLRHSDPDRVAEVCAGALLRLAGDVR